MDAGYEITLFDVVASFALFYGVIFLAKLYLELTSGRKAEVEEFRV